MNNVTDLLKEALFNIKFHLKDDGEYVIETSFSPIGSNTKYLACNISKDNTVEEIKEILLQQIRWSV